MIQMLVPREDYVQANSLVHGSRAFSFLAGNSVGGATRAVAARAVRACGRRASRFSGRRSSSDGCTSTSRPALPARSGGLMAGRTLDPQQRDHPRRVARRRDAQLLQLHLLRAVRALRDAAAARLARRRSDSCSASRSVGTLGGSFVTARIGAAHRGRADVRARLLPLPRAADPGPARRRAALARPRAALRLGVRVGHRPDAARHHGRDDQRRAGADALRSRVSGAFMVVNYGVRPLGTSVGGVLGATIGLRPTLWIATVGALAGLLWILPSPIMSLHDVPAEAAVTAAIPLSCSTSGSTATRWCSRPRPPTAGRRLRMVLLKSADERGFTFFTNYESRKGHELSDEPARGAALPRRPDLQVRVEGRVERIAPSESDAYWATRPPASRRSAAASRQSQPIGSRAELEAAVAAQPAEPARPDALGRLPADPGDVRVLAPPRRPLARTSPV